MVFAVSKESIAEEAGEAEAAPARDCIRRRSSFIRRRWTQVTMILAAVVMKMTQRNAAVKIIGAELSTQLRVAMPIRHRLRIS